MEGSDGRERGADDGELGADVRELGADDGEHGADRREQGADEGKWGQMSGRGRMEANGKQTGGQADGGERCRMDCPKSKTPYLTRQLIWPLEIQRGRPWVTV